jgi:hypothetical protein
LFHGDALLAISGGPSATLEPVLLQQFRQRDVLLLAARRLPPGRADARQRRGCPGHRGAGEHRWSFSAITASMHGNLTRSAIRTFHAQSFAKLAVKENSFSLREKAYEV